MECFPCSASSWLDVAGPIKPEVYLFFRQYLLFILGPVHLIFSLWMVVEYFVVNYPNFILPLPSFFYTRSEVVFALIHIFTLSMFWAGLGSRDLNRPTQQSTFMVYAQCMWCCFYWHPSSPWLSMAIFMHSVFSTLLSTMTFFSECFALSQRMVYPLSLVVCVRYTLSLS